MSNLSSDVHLYTTRFCPYCVRAKQLLKAKGVTYREIGVDSKPHLRAEMMERSGRRTVPQIWIGSRHIGGNDDLWALDARGELDGLLNLAD